jgi:hypothetical protein
MIWYPKTNDIVDLWCNCYTIDIAILVDELGINDVQVSQNDQEKVLSTAFEGQLGAQVPCHLSKATSDISFYHFNYFESGPTKQLIKESKYVWAVSRSLL